MKKLLVVLLAIVMVLPLGLVANAEESVGTQPFYNMLFQDIKSEYGELSEYTLETPYFYTGVHTLQRDLDNIVEFEWEKVNYRDIYTIAAKLKSVNDERPKGARYVHFQLPYTALHNLCEDVIYTDAATKIMKEWFEKFLAEYSRIGGKVDGFILDLEYSAAEAYDLYYRIYPEDNSIFKRIVENPQYETKVRPLLVERGFKFFDAPTELTTELWSLTVDSGEYVQCAEIWDVAIRNMINNDVTDALMGTLSKYYPDAILTDYQAKNTYNWLKTPSDYGGTGINPGGNFVAIGNNSNYNTYFVRPPLHYYVETGTDIPTYNFPHSYYKAVYENTPFHMFLWDSNIFKDLYAARGDDKVSMWINGYDYNLENPNSASNTPYYAETMLHMTMLNPEPWLSWITLDTYDMDEEAYQYSLMVLDSLMVEVNRVLSAADREPILVPSRWNDSFVLSGMYAGGKNIWRLTPDTTRVSKEAFKVEGEDPTFFVDGKTITFPQGKIIEDGEILEVGTCGYWIETPKDVTPVITNSTYYYSEYPAFQEDFESYAPNTEYSYDFALPSYTWEFKKSKDGTAIVVADKNNANNQVLALTGNYTVTSIKMPENITAGESYAEKQMWEITVTLPANMGEEAEVILLNCIGQKKKKSSDAGVKIANGKFYYDQAGEYQELSGVDLSAGGTYTIRREVNFTDPEALTSTYSILDYNGNLMGRVKNVPMVKLILPMASISFGVNKVTGDAVTVDNYKLYPTGVTADLELYDADLGLYLEDTTQARAEDTAYRLSWLNATGKEKTYSVVAAYYEGDTKVSEKVVQEVKMAPGTDGIDTAIVECEEGKSVLVYLRNDSPAEEEEDDFIPGTPSNKPVDTPNKGTGSEGLSTTTMIIVIVAALCVVGLFLVILATSKPKKKAAKAEEPKAEETDDTAE